MKRGATHPDLQVQLDVVARRADALARALMAQEFTRIEIQRCLAGCAEELRLSVTSDSEHASSTPVFSLNRLRRIVECLSLQPYVELLDEVRRLIDADSLDKVGAEDNNYVRLLDVDAVKRHDLSRSSRFKWTWLYAENQRPLGSSGLLSLFCAGEATLKLKEQTEALKYWENNIPCSEGFEALLLVDAILNAGSHFQGEGADQRHRSRFRSLLTGSGVFSPAELQWDEKRTSLQSTPKTVKRLPTSGGARQARLFAWCATMILFALETKSEFELRHFNRPTGTTDPEVTFLCGTLMASERRGLQHLTDASAERILASLHRSLQRYPNLWPQRCDSRTVEVGHDGNEGERSGGWMTVAEYIAGRDSEALRIGTRGSVVWIPKPVLLDALQNGAHGRKSRRSERILIYCDLRSLSGRLSQHGDLRRALVDWCNELSPGSGSLVTSAPVLWIFFGSVELARTIGWQASRMLAAISAMCEHSEDQIRNVDSHPCGLDSFNAVGLTTLVVRARISPEAQPGARTDGTVPASHDSDRTEPIGSAGVTSEMGAAQGDRNSAAAIGLGPSLSSEWWWSWSRRYGHTVSLCCWLASSDSLLVSRETGKAIEPVALLFAEPSTLPTLPVVISDDGIHILDPTFRESGALDWLVSTLLNEELTRSADASRSVEAALMRGWDSAVLLELFKRVKTSFKRRGSLATEDELTWSTVGERWSAALDRLIDEGGSSLLLASILWRLTTLVQLRGRVLEPTRFRSLVELVVRARMHYPAETASLRLFEACDLRSTTVVLASFDGEDFERSLLNGATFERVSFRDGRLMPAVAAETDKAGEITFTDCLFDGCTLDGAGAEYGDSAWVRSRFERCSFRGVTFTAVEFSQSTFRACRFADCTFESGDGLAALDECRFEGCDFSATHFSLDLVTGAQLIDCRVRRSDVLIGQPEASIDVEGCTFLHTKFSLALLRGTTARKSSFKSTEFVHCTFEESASDGAIADVSFVECRFTETRVPRVLDLAAVFEDNTPAASHEVFYAGVVLRH